MTPAEAPPAVHTVLTQGGAVLHLNGSDVDVPLPAQAALLQGTVPSVDPQGWSLTVALMFQDRIVGAIAFHALGGERVFEVRDLPLAEALAGQIGMALAHAEAYEAARDMAATSQALVASVSHDLLNPLTVILAETQLLRRTLQEHWGDASARADERLSHVENNASRMASLVAEMLDASRLQAGHPLDLHLALTDLVALAHTAVANVRSTRHVVELRASEPRLIGVWDSSRLARVLGNLVENAVKYSPSGGRVVVRLYREEDEQGAWAVAEVQDFGIGIPPSDLPRVFDRFFRAENARGLAPGTGIGLANAREIVEQHGGRIAVMSDGHTGTTFTLRLPLAPSHA